MRILLGQNSRYYPAHGGGDKSNRLLLEALAARGHDCRVVARAQSEFGEREQRRYLAELSARRVPGVSVSGGVIRFPHRGVDVRVVAGEPNLRGYFAAQIEEFRPEIILVSTDDPAQLLLETAAGPNGARVVFLCRTTLALPFGPDAAFPNRERTELLRCAEAVVGVSEYVAGYIRRWSGMEARALPISLLGEGPWPEVGRFDSEFVTLVNPCAVKGIAIFLALADRFRDLRFAAVPTWGTNSEDREALARRPNIAVLDPVDDIDELLGRTRAMLVPSLWAEARSRIVVEAMLRGVPVLAAAVGGIPEAMMGVPYLLPVRPIERYAARVDDRMVPVAEVPEQDSEPWAAALTEVTSDRRRWEDVARASRAAALGYAAGLSVAPFEQLLEETATRPRNPWRDRALARRGRSSPPPPATALSPEKRALLRLRIRRKTGTAESQEWFPNMRQAAGARLRLLCFPYAGGGPSVFRGWQESMPAGVAVAPARLPGRESRSAEPPIDRIDAMVEAVTAAVRPHLDSPFALFGHSLGAMIGFELARRLRREHLPQPRALLVAGARAPQFRRDHVPPPAPSDEEFVREIRDLDGAPREVLDNPELLRYLLPALKADAAMGRLYVYQEEPPLEVPIRAYRGLDDQRLPREVVAAWSRQTTASFALREFPGGHFFLHSNAEEFLRALAADVSAFY